MMFTSSLIHAKLDRILNSQVLILKALQASAIKENTMQLDLTALTAKVQAAVTIETSAVALITGMAQNLKDLAATLADEPDVAAVQAKLNDFATQLDGATGPLSTAVTTNTPAAPAPPAA